MDKSDYFREANEAVIVIQLEGSDALDNLDAILAEEGFDIVSSVLMIYLNHWVSQVK